MTPVIWTSGTVAPVVAAFVIRFGNVARSQSPSWPPPAAQSQAGREPVALRLLLPPSDHLPPAAGDGPGVVLQQHPAQHLDRGDLPPPARRRAVVDGFQQGVPVAGVGDRQLVALRLRQRGPPGGHRGAVAAGEVGHADPVGQPVRAHGGQRLQHGPHAFPRQLQPVQGRDRRDHVRGVGPLLPARLDQAVCRQPCQQRQRALDRTAPVDGQPGRYQPPDDIIDFLDRL